MNRSQTAWKDLRRYYDVLFPIVWPILERFITQDGRYHLRQCELSPRWEKGNGTVMARSHTFETSEEVITYCQKTLPDTLQLGGIVPDFNHEWDRMKRNRDMCSTIATGYGPIVFDIDMNDYARDGICPCLDQKKVCNRCFTILGDSSRKVIHYLMEEIFGMSDIIDVYSGKRGFHVWVCCERAMRMTKDERTTLIKRLASPILNEGISDDIYREILLPVARSYPNVFDKCDKATLMQRLYPKFDVGVTTDACHPKKLPLMPHQQTRYVAVILDPNREFLPEDHWCHIGQMSQGTYRRFATALESFMNKQKKRVKLDE